MKKNIFTILVAALTTISTTLLTVPKSIAEELPPDEVIQSMYAGVATIHGYRAIPKVYRPIPAGFQTGCGAMEPTNAIYCKLDHSIYISIDMVRMAYRYGDAALAYTIGHEYAHAMQRAYNFNSNNSPISELQADCLAGFYMAAVPNLSFDEQDIQEVRAFAYSLGDNDTWSQNHHGTPRQRLKAVSIGMNASSFSACQI